MGFPFQKQHDSMQCGIACLQMVCQYYGRKYTCQTLSGYCMASTEGVSLLAISQAAQRLGFQTTSGKVAVGLRNCFEFLQKVFLGLMHSFSCVLWAIFCSFPLLFFVRQPAIFLIIEAEMPQKLIPNHRTINSKQFLKAER